MNVWPTQLKLAAENQLLITWSDGQQRRYSFRELRDKCPCATCREKRSQPRPATWLPIMTEAEAQPLQILGMKPVGNYAYTIHFSDGHDTGIYSLDLLR
jgi:DUF971 family protein